VAGMGVTVDGDSVARWPLDPFPRGGVGSACAWPTVASWGHDGSVWLDGPTSRYPSGPSSGGPK